MLHYYKDLHFFIFAFVAQKLNFTLFFIFIILLNIKNKIKTNPFGDFPVYGDNPEGDSPLYPFGRFKFCTYSFWRTVFVFF